MMNPIWKLAEWPQFSFETKGLEDILYTYAAQANSLAGRLDGVEEAQRQMALIDLMVTEAGVVR